MKKSMKLTALLLCIAMLTSTLAGCGLFGGSSDGKDESENEFNPPYLENYYVNKHTPVVKSGKIEGVYKYENKDSQTFVISGHEYHGGIILQTLVGPTEYPHVEFPLDGQYDYFSFVLGGDYRDKRWESSFALDGSYPTIVGKARDLKLAFQIIIDGVVKEEFIVSCYDVAKRYTYDVNGAKSLEIRAVMGDDGFMVPMMEITVWNGEPHETGHIPESAGSKPVQLIKDLKPYLIPSTSSAVYYPNPSDSSEGRNYINMSGIRYENVMATYVSMGLTENDTEEMFFNLEGKYNYLTFTAGVADRTTTYSEGTAWLSVYADGKIIYEEIYSSHELPRKIMVNVEGCHQLVFAWMSDEGNMEYGNSTGNYFGVGDAYVATTEAALNTITYSSRDLPDRPVKMISELGTFGVFSNMDDEAVFDGSTQFRTFSMGGVKYNEGIMLYASHSMLQTKPACASFNLDGKYNTISFIAGHISNSDVYKNDTIEIYADGVLIKTIEVDCTMLPQEYVVEVNGCRHLEFVSGKLTNNSMYRPALGIANLIAYPERYVETDLFPDRKPADYGKSCDLIETFGFYDVHSGGRMDNDIGAVDVEDGYYDGSTQKNYFTIGNRKVYSGVLLRTSVHLSFDTGEADALLGFNIAGYTVLALAAAGEAHESAFALANIKDSGYTSVTFTVAMQKERTAAGGDDETVLKIGANDKSVWETTLSKDMEPTTYTVVLGEDCERLLFFLECALEDDASHTYAIYDITLNK